MTTEASRTSKSTSRRKFLAGAGATGAAAVAMPQVSRAQTVTWKYQSTWPTKDIFHEDRGRLRQEGQRNVGRPSQARRARRRRGGAGLPDGRTRCIPAFSMAATASAPTGTASTRPIRCSARRRRSAGTRTACSAWFYAGGGEALYKELVNDILKLNLVGFLYFPMPTQPLGWFKKEIKSGDDFKGMKYRTVGLSADVFKEMGAAVTILPGGEIVPAMDRGLLDAAEFNNPSSDILLGFPDVSKFYMMGSHHQQVECFEVIFNKAKFDALPPELKAILRNAAHAASSDQLYTAYDRYSKDLEAIRKRGVNVIKTQRQGAERRSSRPGTR